jgi:hypothetical protein
LGSALNPTVETSFSAASSEVLANGMTATASFDVLGNGSQGTVGLSGDFGTLSAGTSEGTDQTDPAVAMSGISYTGSFAGLSVNAASGKYDTSDSDYASSMGTDYTKYGASYDFNGLALGANNTNGTNKLTASYAFGDLTVSGSKTEGADAVVKAAYSATMGDLAVSASADSADTWDVSMTYTMGDIAITAKDDEAAGGAALSAKYTSGALSLTIDSDSDVDVAYDMGNADLAISRDTDADATTVSYTVSF